MTDSHSCLNCQTPLKGNYCYACGQSTRGADRFFLTLVNEAFEDIFSLNSRVWKTLGNLLWRPGYLSKEYFAGRRVRYIPPVRLYFTLSILFFLVVSIYSFFEPQPVVSATPDQAQEVEASTKEEPALPKDIGVNEDINVNEAVDEPDPAKADDEDVLFNFDIDDEDEIKIPWVSEERSEGMQNRFRNQVKKANAIYKANPEAPSEYLREIAPPLIFCLLPLFALLLKLFYVFKGMYYTQHLILALHDHCFVFLWLTLFELIDWVFLAFGGTPTLLSFIMFSWCVIYLWRSLRVIYQQGKFATTVKFILLSISYIFLAILAFFASVIFGIMTV